YPKAHKKYMFKIEKNGGFISKFWSSDVFDRNNFLKRNRIIAGVSEATIVIESAEKGGSLVTADIANSYSRDVFAVPGRVADVQSQGCNTLIKTQQAQMITSAADLIYALGWDLEGYKSPPRQTQLFVEFTEQEKGILKFLKEKDSASLDDIAVSCLMPTHTVAGLLLGLELKGVIKPLPGKRFKELVSF
ncbi:MAG: DNA-protecting protein DprA, partial [Bacteroidetes bacterium]|nr:DNA-protecting protein DprA [Bacteroidota bacterium]